MNSRNLTSAAVLALLVATAPAAMAKPGHEGDHSKERDRADAAVQGRSTFDQRFTQYDRNGDGVVTRNEFAGSAQDFDRFDQNRDGVLSRAELNQYSDNRNDRNYGGSYDRNGDGVISRDEFQGDAREFERRDRNHDGVLSQADRSYGNENAGGRRFRGMDSNGDGIITRNEWRGNDNSFRKHDRNGDGVISGDELRGNGKNKAGKHDRDRDDRDDR